MRREDKERRKKEGDGRLVHQGFHHRRVEGFYGRDGEMEYEFAREWEKENRPEGGRSYGLGLLQNLLIREDKRWGIFHKPIIWLTPRDAAVAAEVIQWLGTNCGFCFLRQVMEKSGYTLTQKKNTRDSSFYEEMNAVSRLHRLTPKLSRVEIYRRLRSIRPGGHADVCGHSIYYGRSGYKNPGEEWVHVERWSCSHVDKESPVYGGVSAGELAKWLYETQDRDIAEARAAVDAILNPKEETDGK